MKFVHFHLTTTRNYKLSHKVCQVWGSFYKKVELYVDRKFLNIHGHNRLKQLKFQQFNEINRCLVFGLTVDSMCLFLIMGILSQ